jgi:hypothetical protein
MTANWRSTETPNVVYLHRATLLDEDVSYPLELGQGRNAKNPIPAFSMYAGEPEFTEADNKLRATVWRIYSLVIAAMVIAAIVSVAAR